jgi:8-oxo-dGTP pyrophosphatase MutT (NUDIX family)
VAFPGGYTDEGDYDDVEVTALREAAEELDLGSGTAPRVQLLGLFHDAVAKTSVIGMISPID